MRWPSIGYRGWVLLLALLLWTDVFAAGGASPASQPSAKPLVVLDPGHGGRNYGAYGAALGKHEKRLTLTLAKATARRLRKAAPGVRVLLTRYRDRYVSLRDRVLRANLAGAQLFVSIHLNACETHARRGFETFVVSHDASDQESARLAAKENGRRLQRQEPVNPVSAIVADMQQRALHGRSLRLALAIQRALARARPDVPSRGVRQAPFDVLMGLRMPGVLVELGFIDHAQEGLELARPEVQRRLADGLARGIAAHLESLSADRALSTGASRARGD